MDNLQYYNALRKVPQEAQKEIQGGRLKGFTDINPMWRIKMLTETFGPCGFGWRFTVDRAWTENANGEILAFVNISLFVKADGAWSEAIIGTGGSKILTNERSGLVASDEGYKMATTDALSYACKNLGIGADVYWSGDRTKYSVPADPAPAVLPASKQLLTPPKVTNITLEQLDARKALLVKTVKALGGDAAALRDAEAKIAQTSMTETKPLRAMTEAEFAAHLKAVTEAMKAGAA